MVIRTHAWETLRFKEKIRICLFELKLIINKSQSTANGQIAVTVATVMTASMGSSIM